MDLFEVLVKSKIFLANEGTDIGVEVFIWSEQSQVWK